MIALRGAIHSGVFSSFMFLLGRLAMPPIDVSVWGHATSFCRAGVVVVKRLRGRKKEKMMTDQDIESFAELVNGAIDYRNGCEVVICARKGCRLYLRRNTNAPFGCHFALAAMTTALNRTAVSKNAQTGLKGWNSNGRMDVDYCPTKNPRSKIGNAVRFTPRAVSGVQPADVLHYLAILSMELKEKLRLAGVL